MKNKISKIFFISDTHFNHKNIIKYANRPFKSIKDMDKILIRNWNSVVNKHDIVYFLGDFVLRKNPSHYLRQLNGRIIFIRGNHDKYYIGRNYTHRYLTFSYNNIYFYLTHVPYKVPDNWKGWSITGHIHNSGPLINRKYKQVNVSVEQIGYKPIEIKKIIERIGIENL